MSRTFRIIVGIALIGCLAGCNLTSERLDRDMSEETLTQYRESAESPSQSSRVWIPLIYKDVQATTLNRQVETDLDGSARDVVGKLNSTHVLPLYCIGRYEMAAHDEDGKLMMYYELNNFLWGVWLNGKGGLTFLGSDEIEGTTLLFGLLGTHAKVKGGNETVKFTCIGPPRLLGYERSSTGAKKLHLLFIPIPLSKGHEANAEPAEAPTP